MVKKYNVGYTSGVYDLFHIGHLNILRNAKSYCDKLIVGVSSDELVQYKNKKSVIPFNERIEIVKHIVFVDEVVCQSDMNKMNMWEKLKFDVIIGMYHDQVLTPFKALYNFDAINITLGLPSIRISPDHGVAENITGKKIANPKSLINSIKFFNNIKN